MYDDKPLYARYEKTNNSTGHAPMIKDFDRYALRPNGATVSPVQSWYVEENKKREQGIENEIDLNEMRAAIRGVKNKWFLAVKNNPNMFVEDKVKKINWQEVIKLI